jgi:hypothetical protein
VSIVTKQHYQPTLSCSPRASHLIGRVSGISNDFQIQASNFEPRLENSMKLLIDMGLWGLLGFWVRGESPKLPEMVI